MLSVIVPVFNECETLPHVLQATALALPTVAKEIIIVDDGSTDGTAAWLRSAYPAATGTLATSHELVGTQASHAPSAVAIRVFYHTTNRGKGAALRTGLVEARGDVIVIQDADLEYDPQEWGKMYPLIAERGVADVVFGCRFFGAPHRSLYFHHYCGNRLISFLFNLLYNQTLADIEVGYKMISRAVKERLALTSDDFGIEIEITAQIARHKLWRIYEVGIAYYGRTYAQGKKINWKDGAWALWYLIKFRFQRLPKRALPIE